MENDLFVLLLLLMPVTAFLYASVGHGGASSYLMLLTLFGFVPNQIKPSALLLNILISGIAFWQFQKTCSFQWKLFYSLICYSIPAAYLGGALSVESGVYKIVLGILLIFPILRLLNFFPVQATSVRTRWWMIPVLGLSIGFISGLIGIGGGIILSPVLLILGWSTVKETAALSALFIFVNSIAGLLGHKVVHITIPSELYSILPLSVVGGIAGAYMGAQRFNIPSLKYLLAMVLTIASVKFLLAA